MGVFIIAAAALFLLTSLFFLIQLLRKKNRQKQSNIQLLLLPLGIVLFYYMIVLSGRVNVFYFPAPYKDPLSVAVSMTSYIPFLVVLVMPPLLLLNYRVLKQDNWSSLAKVLLTANNLTCMTLIGLFAYWRFYDVFS